MATKTKTAKTKTAEAQKPETYTLEEAARIIAERKKAARAATAERRKRTGIHPVEPTPGDIAAGVLAKCENVTAVGGTIIHGTAYRRKDTGTVGYTLDVNPWRYGITGTPDEIAAKIAALGDHGADTVGWLEATVDG